MLRRGPEADVFPYCQQRTIGVIAYSPMASGTLSGKVTRESVAALPSDDPVWEMDHYREPQLSKLLDLIDTLREIGLAHHRTIGEVAVAWVLRLPAVTGAIVGLRCPAQVDAIVGAAELRLGDDEIARIEAHLDFQE
jgi:aryl-alcohol dehydrogenase-like predicted oxidoreductase